MRPTVALSILALLLVPFAEADLVGIQTDQEESSCHNDRTSSETGGWSDDTYAGERFESWSSGCASHKTLFGAEVADGLVSVGVYNDTSNETSGDNAIDYAVTYHNDTNTMERNYTYTAHQEASTRSATTLQVQAVGNTATVSRACGKSQQTTYTGTDQAGGSQSNFSTWTTNQTHQHHGTGQSGCAHSAGSYVAGQEASATWFEGCYTSEDHAGQTDWSPTVNDTRTLHRRAHTTDRDQCGTFVDATSPAGGVHADQSATCTRDSESDFLRSSNSTTFHDTGHSGSTQTCDYGPTLEVLSITVSVARRTVETVDCNIGTQRCSHSYDGGVLYRLAWPDSPAGAVDQGSVLP